ncbi:hypothetical protein [Nocardia stercoris]|uniref:Uncharacterized protein n=1 Tax=Nocardia stercoris TaxID=2483361 RepID=A0A3M2L589_9NOCA|nr:hypothetical protein [Nocardia stercoris]RMI32554.1 hypothetical protein EBN03_11235 [Nocardia stercoris]
MSDVQDGFGRTSTAVDQSGLLALVLSADVPRLREEMAQAATLAATVPEATVDGVVVARGWGTWTVPVAPGTHSVMFRCHVYGNVRRVAQAQVRVEPAGREQVYYRVRRDGTAGARAGRLPGSAGSVGIARMVVGLTMLSMMLGLLVLMLALVAAIL